MKALQRVKPYLLFFQMVPRPGSCLMTSPYGQQSHHGAASGCPSVYQRAVDSVQGRSVVYLLSGEVAEKREGEEEGARKMDEFVMEKREVEREGRHASENGGERGRKRGSQ